MSENRYRVTWSNYDGSYSEDFSSKLDAENECLIIIKNRENNNNGENLPKSYI
jgi:hypothetical protein